MQTLVTHPRTTEPQEDMMERTASKPLSSAAAFPTPQGNPPEGSDERLPPQLLQAVREQLEFDEGEVPEALQRFADTGVIPPPDAVERAQLFAWCMDSGMSDAVRHL